MGEFFADGFVLAENQRIKSYPQFRYFSFSMTQIVEKNDVSLR